MASRSRSNAARRASVVRSTSSRGSLAEVCGAFPWAETIPAPAVRISAANHDTRNLPDRRGEGIASRVARAALWCRVIMGNLCAPELVEGPIAGWAGHPLVEIPYPQPSSDGLLSLMG